MSTGHIRQRGAGAWELKYDIGHDPVTKRRLTRYATVRGSKKDAQRELTKLLSARDKGEDVAPSKLTVAELAHERISRWHQISPSTKETYENDAKMFAPIGHIPAQKLSTRDVEQWHGELRSRGLAQPTISKAHGLLGRVLAEAVRHGMLVRNVAREQPLPKSKRAAGLRSSTSEADPRTPGEAQGPRLRGTGGRRVVLRLAPRRDVGVALVGSGSRRRHHDSQPGARGNDVRGPAQGDKDGERHADHQPAAGGHRSSTRASPAAAQARRAAGRRAPASDALVFPAPLAGGFQGPRSFSVRWGRVAASLRMPHDHLARVRHTHASMLIAAGVPITTVSRRLGHASPNVTLGVYAHLFTKDDRAAAEAINAALGGLK